MTNGSSATNSKSVRPGYYCGVDVRNLHVSLLLFRCQLSLSVLACLKRSRISSRCPLKFDHDKSFEPVYIYCDGLIISGFNEGLLNWSYQLSSPYMSYFECVRCSVHSSENRPTIKWIIQKKRKRKRVTDWITYVLGTGATTCVEHRQVITAVTFEFWTSINLAVVIVVSLHHGQTGSGNTVIACLRKLKVVLY